ncbi:ribosomal RNA small subunit methyltransferase E [Pseudomonas asuensis]|jgi:16S rRNA (uracil1498-N3)-methyltransferase|uniref:Ribosomal RNA small subunit methyltransferase E n=1 Tax=Pseudomonas asuensis TaxID=1825787 RepID=A0ABQ2GNW4_9PSED|nr:16S rRNA (uracil(1498)-N(3))-methyltransferase [Pseudomonas asuensis]GGM04247.1 ribosomal RNA small subunit methyltransferase E [Pseudomonas asuensis]
MRLSRFYVDIPLSLGQQTLPEAQAHYMGRVLRLAPGTAVQLFDGSGHEYKGVLTDIGKRSVLVDIQERISGLAESSLRIHLGQGLSRGERMDWAIQKATELGATEITPIMTERCEVRLKDERADKRLLHWKQVAISACEQCGRSTLPVIHAPVTLTEWIERAEADLKLVLHPVAESMTTHTPPSSLAFLIGPEGGLTDNEVNEAKRAGFVSARLGPRVLRTETAPVVALAVAQQLWGDF